MRGVGLITSIGYIVSAEGDLEHHANSQRYVSDPFTRDDSEPCDVLIIGGGPSGSTAAALIAEKGRGRGPARKRSASALPHWRISASAKTGVQPAGDIWPAAATTAPRGCGPVAGDRPVTRTAPC